MANEIDTTLLDNLNSIKNSKADIKQALIDKGQNPTNVFADYAQLISDIQTGEDLDEQLTAQDQKIAELEEALENKTAGKAKLNIFVQENEPTIKMGIWLQTNKELEHIYGDDDIFIAGEWKPDGSYRHIPYQFASSSAVAIGTDVYLLGSNYYSTYAYKYNTLTNTYTQLTNIPYGFYSGSAVAIGTDVYLFGGSGNNTYAYKYSTLTDTYTQLANIPYRFVNGPVVAVGTDIYLFGSGNGSYSTYAYKYNTLINTYTQLTNIPYQFTSGSAVAIGTDVYLLGSSGNNTYAYKYSTLTDTYTQLTNIPYSFYRGSAVAVGTDVYLFGSGNSSYRAYAYKYNTLTDTYTQLTNIPYQFYSGSAVAVGTDVYLLGGEANNQKVQVYVLESSTYANNSVVIAQGRYYQSGYGVELYNDTLFSSPMLYAFADAWFYTTEDGIITDIPTYYGDGTQWIKFKN